MSIFSFLTPLALAAPGEPMSFRLGDMWAKMGPFARGVAGVLALMSVYAVALMAERLWTYWTAARESRRYARRLDELLRAGKYGEAAGLAKELRRGHLAQVLGPAIEEYHRALPAGATGPSPEAIAAAARCLERRSGRTAANLRRGLGGLATIGSTAPFVGLLGTVAGIISAFEAMAQGSVGLGSVSAGIAEALVTTAFGLLVAIPSVMMFNALSGRVENMEVDLEEAGAELLDFFSKPGGRDGPRLD